jgi:hemolysin activation/secretion protein
VTDPSEILSDEEIEQIAAKYMGRSLDMQGLYEIVDDFNRLYAKKGYVTARALLPAQTIKNGTVAIELVEGRVGQVVVRGNEYTDTDYLLDRISLKPGDLVEVGALENDVLRLGATNDIRVRAELGAGSAFGTTDIYLLVQEPQNSEGLLFFDNSGQSESGLYRANLTMVKRSVSGRRDPLTISIMGSEGTAAGSIAYELPVGVRGTRAAIGYSYTKASVTSGDFSDLEVEVESSGLSLSLRHPLLLGLEKNSELRCGISLRETKTFSSGFQLLETRLGTLNCGLSEQDVGTYDGRQCVSTSQLDFTGGFPDDGKRFIKCSIQFTHEQLHEDQGYHVLRFTGQWTASNLLPSSEQYNLGGVASVRGYPEGMLAGDKGFFMTVELHRPLVSGAEYYYFLDHGAAYPYKGEGGQITDEDYLTSIGIGVKAILLQRISGHLVIGQPVGRDGYGTRIHLSVQASLW